MGLANADDMKLGAQLLILDKKRNKIIDSKQDVIHKTATKY